MPSLRNEPSLPVTMLDEALLLLQEARSSWNVQFELGADHHVDEATFRQAVLSCYQRHPLTRARMATARNGETSYQWNFADEVDRDPVRVVDCPNDAALDRLRAELYTPPIALDVSPGLRVALARRPAGELVLLSASHIVADGVGALRLMQTIARAYLGEPDPPDPLPLAQARDLGSFLAPKNRSERWARHMEGLRRFREAFDAPSRIAVVGGTDREDFGFVFRTVDLGETTTPGLVQRAPGTTVNDVLLAALHLTVGLKLPARRANQSNRGHDAGQRAPRSPIVGRRQQPHVECHRVHRPGRSSGPGHRDCCDGRADLIRCGGRTARTACMTFSRSSRRHPCRSNVRCRGCYHRPLTGSSTPRCCRTWAASPHHPPSGVVLILGGRSCGSLRRATAPAAFPSESPPAGQRLALVARYRYDQFDAAAAEEFTDLLIAQVASRR